jgi:hypothetical protein
MPGDKITTLLTKNYHCCLILYALKKYQFKNTMNYFCQYLIHYAKPGKKTRSHS